MASTAKRQRPTVRQCIRANFSTAFLYPLKGIYYFATHRYLHPLLQSRLVPLTLLSTCVLVLLFLTLYVPLVAFLALFHYQGSAWVNGTFLLLGIGSLLVSMIFEALFVDHVQVDVYDSVLIYEGYEDLVRTRRSVAEAGEEVDPLKRLGAREKGAEFAPFILRQILEFTILLPVNFIPFAGVPLFLLLTGYRAGPLLSWRFFALKGFTKQQRKEFIKTKRWRWEFMWFGTVHMTLQLVPILSMMFLLTSAAGSALLAVRFEEEIREREVMQEEEENMPPGHQDSLI